MITNKEDTLSTANNNNNGILPNEDKCRQCHLVIEETCWRFYHDRWHTQCLVCNNCKQKIEPPFNARIGVHHLLAGQKPKSTTTTTTPTTSIEKNQAESNLILLCDKCTIDPRTRRNYLMQQTPLSRVTQLEQCMHLLRVALARVHQVPIGKVTHTLFFLKKNLGSHSFYSISPPSTLHIHLTPKKNTPNSPSSLLI